MKFFKPIEDFNEEEFSDFTYFKTDLSIEKTGLKFKLSSIVNPYFNKNAPHIYVIFNDVNYLNYKTNISYAVIKISSNPYIITNNINHPGESLEDIYRFIKINKKILMKYWNWKCSSFELKNNIRRINE